MECPKCYFPNCKDLTCNQCLSNKLHHFFNAFTWYYKRLFHAKERKCKNITKILRLRSSMIIEIDSRREGGRILFEIDEISITKCAARGPGRYSMLFVCLRRRMTLDCILLFINYFDKMKKNVSVWLAFHILLQTVPTYFTYRTWHTNILKWFFYSTLWVVI